MSKVQALTSHIKSKISKSASQSSCYSLYNATNNKTRDKIQFATPEDIQQAIQDASSAQERWHRDHTPAQRSEILQKASYILTGRSDEITAHEVKDTGRTISEIKSYDVPAASRCLSYYANMPSILSNGTYHDIDHSFAYVKREPIGVTAGIGAWNYPLMNAVAKSAPSLSFGNSMLFKPSELTPNSALILADIYEEAGVPPGVFQVLLGDGSVGAELVASPSIGKVSFTGSVETGKKLCQIKAAAESNNFSKMTLELGGKSPFIIMEDADLDQAVTGAMQANWYSNGQVCSNGTRVFVHESLKDEFLERLVERTKLFKIGDPMQEDTEVGPMVSENHMNNVLNYIEIGKNADKAQLLYGGERVFSSLEDGFYLTPAIFSNCTDDMKIVQEEVFGMLMSVLTFQDEDEVMRRANATQFGLAAGIFTNDIKRAHRMANHLKAGNVWINNYNLGPVELPWGGCKHSGVGRENGSYDAAFEWTMGKSVYVEMDDI
jgi:betaine-aldehyde dehydrogenase